MPLYLFSLITVYSNNSSSSSNNNNNNNKPAVDTVLGRLRDQVEKVSAPRVKGPVIQGSPVIPRIKSLPSYTTDQFTAQLYNGSGHCPVIQRIRSLPSYTTDQFTAQLHNGLVHCPVIQRISSLPSYTTDQFNA